MAWLAFNLPEQIGHLFSETLSLSGRFGIRKHKSTPKKPKISPIKNQIKALLPFFFEAITPQAIADAIIMSGR